MEQETRTMEAQGSVVFECPLDNFRFPGKGRRMCKGVTLKLGVRRQLLRVNAGFDKKRDLRGD